MKSLAHHIKKVHEKPHHVRKRIAFSLAFAGTSVVALVWLVGSLALGDFAIAGSSFADATQNSGAAVVVNGKSTEPSLAGAAAAVVTPDTSAAHIEIISTKASVTTQKKEQTIIPF